MISRLITPSKWQLRLIVVIQFAMALWLSASSAQAGIWMPELTVAHSTAADNAVVPSPLDTETPTPSQAELVRRLIGGGNGIVPTASVSAPASPLVALDWIRPPADATDVNLVAYAWSEVILAYSNPFLDGLLRPPRF